jgi:hypothetical protein
MTSIRKKNLRKIYFPKKDYRFVTTVVKNKLETIAVIPFLK